MRQKGLTLILILLLVLPAYAQKRGSITGTVIDARLKDPLIGVNVIIQGTQIGASTDFDGNFLIEKVPVGAYQVRFDYIGYTSVLKTDIIVKISRPAVVNAEMNETLLEGEAVTVTAGYFVEEEKIQTSSIGLTREEIRRFPGGFEDVVRTVSTLPGVAINTAGGRNDLLVRGGGPSENLYTINSIEVPNINHFGNQGSSSGSLSFVNLNFVEDVTFSTGGFSAQYGDKMSSVLALEMMEGTTNRFEGSATISATQYGLDFQLPVRDKGNFIFSARKSYLDLIFKAAGLPFIPVYTDFNILVNYDLSPKDKLFFLGLSAINTIDRDQSTLEGRVTNAGLLDNSQYQGISGLNYRRLLNSGYLDVTLSTNLTKYRFSQMNENEVEYFKSNATEQEFNAKIQHYWVTSKTVGVRSGISSKTILNDNTTVFADTIYDRSGNRIPISFLGIEPENSVNTSGQKFAAFSEIDWLPNAALNVNLGVRADYYGFIDHSLYLAPRLSIKYKIHPKHSLRASGGVYYQSPSYVWTINPVNQKLKALQNQMGILGWDFLARDDLRFSVEGYYKRYRDLPTGIVAGRTDHIIINNTGTGFGGRDDDFQSFGYFDLVSKATGYAYGFEFLTQKRFSEIPFYGILSLSYGKSEYTAGNGLKYPGQYDQRFILNLSGGYIFNSKWEIAAKFRYFTGAPYTPVYRPTENPLNPGSIQNLPEEYLAARLDAGHHLDVRVDRNFNFSNGMTLIMYVDIQNVYDFKIPQRPSYDFWEDKINTSSSIGLLPSLGITLEL